MSQLRTIKDNAMYGLAAICLFGFLFSPKPAEAKKPSLKVLKHRIILGVQPKFDRRAKLDKSCHQQLDMLAKYMNTKAGKKYLRIEAHTHSRGSSRYNLRLTKMRAEAIRKYLSQAGADPTKIIAIGYGESRPIAPNRTRAGRQMNKRVEFRLVKSPKK